MTSDIVTSKLKLFLEIFNLGVVDTCISIKILHYEMFSNNTQGLHTFAIKVLRFLKTFINNLRSEIYQMFNLGIILTYDSNP